GGCFVGGCSNGFFEVDCCASVLAGVRSYRRHMVQFALQRDLEVWYAQVAAQELFSKLLQDHKRSHRSVAQVRWHDSLRALAELTEVGDGHRIIADAPPLVVRLTEGAQSERVQMIVEAYAQTLRGAQRHLLARYQLVDMARKVVGVGSVGTRCYIALLTGRDEEDPLFLQIK